MAKSLSSVAERQLREAVRYSGPRARAIARGVRRPLELADDWLYVRNAYAGDIPPNSFVQLDNSSTLEQAAVTRPSVYAGRRMFVCEGGIRQGEYGVVRRRGICRVLMDESERTASPANAIVSSVGMKKDSFAAFPIGPYQTLAMTAGPSATMWDDDGLCLIDFSQENPVVPFFGTIATSGPAGEANFTNDEYWITPNASSGSNTKIRATNYAEKNEYETPKHLLPTGMVVLLMSGDPTANANRFWFSMPIPVVFIVEIVSATGSSWNGMTYTAKLVWYRADSTNYGPTLTLDTVATVPSNAESSYSKMTAGSRCLAMFWGGTGTYRYVGPVNAGVPTTYYQAGTGGGNKIAVYAT